ncbi:Ulp1 protease family C-terminal catalytic domain [Arabidopsis thaliana x Arabidopsis arenosa]|uniref:Ulp1 protease family C-terminal catalytic domain n=1 Tax=Arabidopsis thaliana x Arabidopsis arenosa TaxID=1240361 RepID=A0A8T2C5D2_9BRAS|nr:Ulp1 protease family C-terminal catalytic domain [Arabidopsis thaliana x Arabidopsis arenosa]
MVYLVSGLETQEVDSESASAVSSEGLHDLEIEDVAHKETEHTEGDEEELGVQDVAPKKSEPIQDLQNEAKGDEEELASGDVAPKEREPIQDSQSEAKGDDEDSQSEAASQMVIVPPQDSPSPVVAPISITESNKVLVPGKADVPSQSSVVGNLGGRRLKRLRTISSKLDRRFQFDKKTKLLVGHPSPIADLTSGYLDPKERFNRSMKKLKAIISISLVGDVTISSKDVLELIERKKTLSNKVMDGLLKFSRHILQTDEVDGAKLRADVLDTKSISQLCRLYPKFFKAPVPQDFQFPTAFVDAVSGVGDFDYAELFTEVDYLYLPFNIDKKHWVPYALISIVPRLPFSIVMFICAPMPASRRILSQSLCIPQVTAHVDAGLMTVFLIHAHAVGGEGTEPHIQTGDGFDLHPESQSTVDSLNDLRRLCHIPPEVEMVVPKPYESPESGREGYCCAYKIYFKGCGLFFPLPEILLIYLNHLGIAFSQMSPNMLRYLMCTFTVAAEAGYSLGLNELLEFFQARESRTSRYYAFYPVADRNLIDGLPLKDNAWRKFCFFFRIDSFSVQSSSKLLRFCWSSNLGPQIRPVPSVDFLNFYKAILERPVNWNSFTLERIHGAGHSVRMGLTHPVDPLPAEIDLSSLNARDRRKIREADKKVKDQISQIGKNKKNASSAGDDKIYRKTLLVDDGSLEGSKSMAVTINNAPPSTPAADNMVAAIAEEEGLTGDSSFMKKRKAEELEPPL